MTSPVDLIKERLGIAEVVGSYLKLEKSGSSLKAKCPFHTEKTPSFFVSPVRGSYYCFGCGAKGDIFSFVQEFEGVDFPGALKILASRAGIQIKPEDPKLRSERDKLFAIVETATLYFQRNLADKEEVKKYLSERGLSEKTIDAWRIGFALDDWRCLFDYLKSKGFSESDIEKAGLIKKPDGEKRYYDRFRSRVIFPIFDPSGRVVAFSGRIFGEKGKGKESAETPKYLNSPETPLFSKSRILYGFDRAKSDIRKKDYSILVEGQVDLLMCHQAGFTNTVATSGTALTGEQLSLLKRLSERIMMVYDADKAGVMASLRSAILALSLGMDVKVAALPSGLDPAEIIKTDLNKWKICLKSSKHIIEFYLDTILQEKLDGRKLARAIKEKLLPFVASVPSSMEKSRFVRDIAEKTGIREQAIIDDLKNTKPVGESVGAGIQNGKISANRKNFIERLIVGAIFWQEKAGESKIDAAKIKKSYTDVVGAENFDKAVSDFKSIADELIFQAESYYSGGSNLSMELEELMLNLEEDIVKDKLSVAVRELTQAEKEKDAVKGKKLLKACHELSKNLEDLKKKRAE